MIEIKVEVKAFRVTALCDECSAGDMEFSGKTMAQIPALYHHRCANPKCSRREWLSDRYPTIRYEEVTK